MSNGKSGAQAIGALTSGGDGGGMGYSFDSETQNTSNVRVATGAKYYAAPKTVADYIPVIVGGVVVVTIVLAFTRGKKSRGKK